MKEFSLNKSNSIYFKGKRYDVVLDTGSNDNYIAKEMAIKTGLEIYKLKENVERYAVDSREIVISECIEMEFTHEGKPRSTLFYVFSGTRKDKILLGRVWMKGKIE